MNCSVAYSEKRLGGYVGWFRLAWKAKSYPVRSSRDGPVLHFKTPEAAELAAWRVKHKIEDPRMRRDGERLSACRSEAEKMFRKVG